MDEHASFHGGMSSSSTEDNKSDKKDKKRLIGTVDPDYFDEPDSKKIKLLQEKGDAEIHDRVVKVVEEHLSKAISQKTSELEEIDENLLKVQQSLNTLRYCVSLNFYARGKTDGSLKDENFKSASFNHPVVQSHLGIRKPSSSSLPTSVCLSKRSRKDINIKAINKETDSSNSKSSYTESDNDSNSSGKKTKKINASDDKNIVDSHGQTSSNIKNIEGHISNESSTDIGEESKVESSSKIINQGRRGLFRKKLRVVIGNTYRYLKEFQSEDSHTTFKWRMYVHGPCDNQIDLSEHISSVKFTLDKSYAPHDVIILKESPFSFSRKGWGEFKVYLKLTFKDPRNKPIQLLHCLTLARLDDPLSFTGLWRLGKEVWYDIWLYDDKHFDKSAKANENPSNGLSNDSALLISSLRSKGIKSELLHCDNEGNITIYHEDANSKRSKERVNKPFHKEQFIGNEIQRLKIREIGLNDGEKCKELISNVGEQTAVVKSEYSKDTFSSSGSSLAPTNVEEQSTVVKSEYFIDAFSSSTLAPNNVEEQSVMVKSECSKNAINSSSTLSPTNIKEQYMVIKTENSTDTMSFSRTTSSSLTPSNAKEQNVVDRSANSNLEKQSVITKIEKSTDALGFSKTSFIQCGNEIQTTIFNSLYDNKLPIMNDAKVQNKDTGIPKFLTLKPTASKPIRLSLSSPNTPNLRLSNTTSCESPQNIVQLSLLKNSNRKIITLPKNTLFRTADGKLLRVGQVPTLNKCPNPLSNNITTSISNNPVSKSYRIMPNTSINNLVINQQLISSSKSTYGDCNGVELPNYNKAENQQILTPNKVQTLVIKKGSSMGINPLLNDNPKKINISNALSSDFLSGNTFSQIKSMDSNNLKVASNEILYKMDNEPQAETNVNSTTLNSNIVTTERHAKTKQSGKNLKENDEFVKHQQEYQFETLRTAYEDLKCCLRSQCEKYSVDEIIRIFLKAIPLSVDKVESIPTGYSFDVPSTSVFKSYPVGTRRGLEFWRAREIHKELMILKPFNYQKWPTFRIVSWARKHGFTPLSKLREAVALDDRLDYSPWSDSQLVLSSLSIPSIDPLDMNEDRVNSQGQSNGERKQKTQNGRQEPRDDSDAEVIVDSDPENDAKEKQKFTRRKRCSNQESKTSIVIRNSSRESCFIQSILSKERIKLKPEEIEPGVHMEVASAVMWQCMMSLMQDVVRSAYAEAISQDNFDPGTSEEPNSTVCINWKHVFRALMRGRPQFGIFTNHGLGKAVPR